MVVFVLISKPMSHIENVLVILYIISIFIYKWLFLKSKRQILYGIIKVDYTVEGLGAEQVTFKVLCFIPF